jgi:hypothetical protein
LPPGAAGSVRNITAHARTINVGPARAPVVGAPVGGPLGLCNPTE